MSTTVDFRINEQILAGPNFEGIPSYADKLKLAQKKLFDYVEEQDSPWKCNKIVLGLLTVLTAGGAVAAFALTGGPSNFLLFASGGVLSFAAIGLVIFRIYQTIQSMQEFEQIRKPYKTQALAAATGDAALNSMEAPETTTEQIALALGQFDIEKRPLFIHWVLKAYFPDAQPKELPENQKKLVQAFARFPNDLKTQPITHPDLARILLDASKSEIAKEVEGANFILGLFDLLSPVDETVVPLLKKQPRALVHLFLANKITKAYFRDIYERLSFALKAELIEQINFENKNIKDTDTDAEEKRIALQKAFVECQTRFIHSVEIQKIEEEKKKEMEPLLEQLVFWPKALANLFCAKYRLPLADSPFFKAPEFVQALHGKMKDAAKKEFIATSVNLLNKRIKLDHNAANLILNWIPTVDVLKDIRQGLIF